MSKIKIFIKAFGLFFAYLICQEITALIANINRNSFIYKNTVLIVGSIVITCVLILIYKDEFFKYFKDFKEKYKEYIPKSVKYWIIGFCIMYAFNICINIIILHGMAPNEEANRILIKNYPIYMAVSACLTGPICEEILFRLSFRESFDKRIPFILFTGILFGAAHLISSKSLIDLIYIFPYCTLGITFSAVCRDTDNILSSIFIHMLHNTLMFILLLAFI